MVRSSRARLSWHPARGSDVRQWLSALLVVGALLVAGRAPAYSMRIAWNAPSGCPDVNALRGSVERLLGEPLLDEGASEALATVSADADAHFTLTLAIRTPESGGTRSVRADTCESIAEVAAFSIALALNPDLTLEPSERAALEPVPEQLERPPASTAAPPTAPPPANPPPQPAADSPTERVAAPGTAAPGPQVWVSAQALFDTSLLPSPAPGGRASAEAVLGDRIRLGIGGLLLAARTKELGVGGGGLFSFWALEARACWQPPLGVTAAICPLFRVGELRGQGRGVEPRLTQVSPIYAPGLELFAPYAWSPRVAATAGLVGYFPLVRDRFVINAGRVHRVPFASLAITLGIAVRAW